MPRIPEYNSNITYEAKPAPRVPSSAADTAGQSAASAGKALAHLGRQIDEKLFRLKQVEDLSNFTLEAQEGLEAITSDTIAALGTLDPVNLHTTGNTPGNLETRGSPDLTVDPEEAHRQFAARAASLRKGIDSRIRDPEVKAKWQALMDREFLLRERDVLHATRRGRIHSARATAERNLARLSALAARTDNPETADNAIGQGVALIRGMTAAGLYPLESGARMEAEWVNSATNFPVID